MPCLKVSVAFFGPKLLRVNGSYFPLKFLLSDFLMLKTVIWLTILGLKHLQGRCLYDLAECKQNHIGVTWVMMKDGGWPPKPQKTVDKCQRDTPWNYTTASSHLKMDAGKTTPESFLGSKGLFLGACAVSFRERKWLIHVDSIVVIAIPFFQESPYENSSAHNGIFPTKPQLMLPGISNHPSASTDAILL